MNPSIQDDVSFRKAIRLASLFGLGVLIGILAGLGLLVILSACTP